MAVLAGRSVFTPPSSKEVTAILEQLAASSLTELRRDGHCTEDYLARNSASAPYPRSFASRAKEKHRLARQSAFPHTPKQRDQERFRRREETLKCFS